MTGFIAIVGTCVALGALLIGSSAHLTKPGMLAAALRRHRVMPAPVVGVAAIAVTAAEAGLAAAGTVALMAGYTDILAALLWTAAALFISYGAYARYVTAKRRGGPCGCSRAEIPMDDWVTTRAIALAVCAGSGALWAGATPTDTAQWTITGLAAATLTLALWQLPAAMRRPTQGGVSAWTS